MKNLQMILHVTCFIIQLGGREAARDKDKTKVAINW